MATGRVVTRVDDLDGSAGASTVRFGLDGRDYEIDLTDAHTVAQAARAACLGGGGAHQERPPYTRIDLGTRATGAGRRVNRRRG